MRKMSRTSIVWSRPGKLAQLAAILIALASCGAAFADGFHYYGNWGGPGHGGGQPMDTLDRAYRRHDHRYAGKGAVGWRASRADGQLIEESMAASLNPFNDTHLHGRVLGPVSAAAFAVKPSLYQTRIVGVPVLVPSTGATSFGLLQAERGVGGVQWAGRKGVNGVKGAWKKIF
jgi:hypothetical protein